MIRRRRGRPLRFVGAVAIGWVGVRTAMLWPDASDPALAEEAPPRPRAVLAGWQTGISSPDGPVAAFGSARALSLRSGRGRAIGEQVILPAAAPRPLAGRVPPPVRPDETSQGAGFAGTFPPPPPPPRMRLRASSWLVLRPGLGIGAAPGAGQLGGGQYGVRLAYGLDAGRRLAGYARLAGPLRGRGAEAALGIEWQPGRGPLRVTVEYRLGLDGPPGGPAIGMVAGTDQRVAPGFRLEAYGQAGAVRRRTTDPYADGAIRLTREVMRGDKAALALGIGAWGAAQREAQRLDLGPSVTAILPVGGTPVRLALDWRQRIAGGARPGSGVALTLGSDF